MNEDVIKEVVVSLLPGLSDETLTCLLDGLKEVGVENREDLAFVQEKDVEKYLRPIQCRKLLNGFKTEGFETVHLDLVPIPSPNNVTSPLDLAYTVPSSLPCPQDFSASSCSQIGRLWFADFRVNWDRMPAGIRRAVANQTRPSPGDRKDMVKAVVEQMFEHKSNPTRATCHHIVRGIVRDYPKSFADVGKNGDVIGDGCYSLLQQIKSRVEYKNRNNTLTRRRRERRPHAEVPEKGTGNARGPVDQYGCVSWCPTELPLGETEASLNDIKTQLLCIYSKEGMGGAERVAPLMEKTYVIQRRHLNSVPAPAITAVKMEWPFLFSLCGMFSHFKLLTNVSILAKLREALDNKYMTILKFCQATKCHPGVKDVLTSFEPEASDKAACILLLVMGYFKEPKDSLVIAADPCATATDVEWTVKLPTTPSLVVQGDILEPRAWMLSVEGQVVMGPHHDFISGLAALFASYYNFNMQYADDASCTLEFIQRCFLGINPEKGSKSKNQHGPINQKVCTFIRKLIDFEWMS